jgi:uncharacterized RDD family membrane protein YckC
MKALNIPTFLNIDLSFEMSSVGRRFGAFFIDLIIKWTYVFVISAVFSIDFNINTTLLTFLIFTPFLLYSFLLEWLNKGQSIGKLLLGIRVIGIDGNPPSVSQCAIRWMFLLVDAYLFALFTFVNPLFAGLMFFSPLVGALFIAIGKNQQRLGDIAAQTYIVRAKETEWSLDDTIYAYFSKKKADYVPQYPEIIKLSDRDMTIVKDLLQRSETHVNYELAHKLANHIKKILNIESKEDDYVFLNKLLEDYNYISLKV